MLILALLQWNRLKRLRQPLDQSRLRAHHAAKLSAIPTGERDNEQIALRVRMQKDRANNRSQPLLAWDLLQRSRNLLAHLAKSLFQQSRKNLILIAEMQIKGSHADVRMLRDLGNARIVIPRLANTWRAAFNRSAR